MDYFSEDTISYIKKQYYTQKSVDLRHINVNGLTRKGIFWDPDPNKMIQIIQLFMAFGKFKLHVPTSGGPKRYNSSEVDYLLVDKNVLDDWSLPRFNPRLRDALLRNDVYLKNVTLDRPGAQLEFMLIEANSNCNPRLGTPSEVFDTQYGHYAKDLEWVLNNILFLSDPPDLIMSNLIMSTNQINRANIKEFKKFLVNQEVDLLW